MKVSIIIPTYNRCQQLKQVISSFLTQNYNNYEIIIIDDHSTDDTFSFLKDITEPRIKYVRLEKHVGSSIARNFGCSKSDSELILMSDDDMPVSSTYLDAMVSCFNKYNYSTIFGRIIKIESINEFGKNYEKIGYPISISKWTGDIKNNYDVSGDEVEIPIGHGCMLLKKEWFDQVGGYNNFPVNGIREESDFCLRLKKVGIRLIYNPNAIIYHLNTTKGGQRMSSGTFRYWGYRNHFKFLINNFGIKSVFMSAFFLFNNILWRDTIRKNLSIFKKGFL